LDELYNKGTSFVLSRQERGSTFSSAGKQADGGTLLWGEIVVGEYRLDILKQLVDLS
jgi:hypothetical protein